MANKLISEHSPPRWRSSCWWCCKGRAASSCWWPLTCPSPRHWRWSSTCPAGLSRTGRCAERIKIQLKIVSRLWEYYVDNFPDGLALVSSSPPETARQVVSCSQWNDANSWLVDKGSFIYINSLIRHWSIAPVPVWIRSAVRMITLLLC